MSYRGDIRLGDTIDIKFSTVSTTGVPTTLAGSPTIAAYPGNSTTEVTAGITLTVDFDARTGLHNVRVVATGGNGYATATNYALVITAGTVGGTSVVGYVIGTFSIEARSALMPTTAARTLVVDSNGRVDLSLWLGSAPNALQSGRVDAYIGAIAAAVIAAGSFAANALDAVWSTTTRTLSAFGFSVTVGTNNDKAGYSLATAPPTATENADALLKRDMSAVSGEAARSPLNALRFLRNLWAISGGTLTVKKEDDSTTAWTASVTTTAGDPVSQIDPT